MHRGLHARSNPCSNPPLTKNSSCGLASFDKTLRRSKCSQARGHPESEIFETVRYREFRQNQSDDSRKGHDSRMRTGSIKSERHGMRRLGLSLGVGILENSRPADRRGEVKTIAIVTPLVGAGQHERQIFFERPRTPNQTHGSTVL